MFTESPIPASSWSLPQAGRAGHPRQRRRREPSTILAPFGGSFKQPEGWPSQPSWCGPVALARGFSIHRSRTLGAAETKRPWFSRHVRCWPPTCPNSAPSPALTLFLLGLRLMVERSWLASGGAALAGRPDFRNRCRPPQTTRAGRRWLGTSAARPWRRLSQG